MESLGSGHPSNGSYVDHTLGRSGEWIDSEQDNTDEEVQTAIEVDEVNNKDKAEDVASIEDPLSCLNPETIQPAPRLKGTSHVDAQMLVGKLREPGSQLTLENDLLEVRPCKTEGSGLGKVLKRLSMMRREPEGTTSRAMLKLLSHIERIPHSEQSDILGTLQQTAAFRSCIDRNDLLTPIVEQYCKALTEGSKFDLSATASNSINTFDDAQVCSLAQKGDWQEFKRTLCQTFIHENFTVAHLFDERQCGVTGCVAVKPTNLNYNQLDAPYSVNWMTTVDAPHGREYVILGGSPHQDVGDITQFAELMLVKAGKRQSITSSWKSHISVHPHDLEKAWNLVMPILVEHGIEHCKVSRLGALERLVHFAHEENDGTEMAARRLDEAAGLTERVVRGMQITVYLSDKPELTHQQNKAIEASETPDAERVVQNRHHYKKIFTEIEKTLISHNIRPGRMDPDTDVVMDSYSSCRYHGNYDKKYDSDRIQNPNPENMTLPYKPEPCVLVKRTSLEAFSPLLTLRGRV